MKTDRRCNKGGGDDNLSRMEKLGIVLQAVAGIMCGIGAGVEIATGADIWYAVITIGSLLYAIGTKLRRI